MFKATRLRVALFATSVVSLLVTAVASASTYDLSPATDSVQAQIVATLPYTLTLGGGILAIFFGWKLVKRFTH